jgi:hypothetical protein
VEFDPKAFDLRWYTTPKEDKIDLLYDLLKESFKDLKEIKDDMLIYEKEIFDENEGAIPRIDKNLIDLKELQTTHTRNIIDQVKRAITNILNSRDVIDDVDACTSDIMKTLDNILEDNGDFK